MNLKPLGKRTPYESVMSKYDDLFGKHAIRIDNLGCHRVYGKVAKYTYHNSIEGIFYEMFHWIKGIFK